MQEKKTKQNEHPPSPRNSEKNRKEADFQCMCTSFWEVCVTKTATCFNIDLCWDTTHSPPVKRKRAGLLLFEFFIHQWSIELMWVALLRYGHQYKQIDCTVKSCFVRYLLGNGNCEIIHYSQESFFILDIMSLIDRENWGGLVSRTYLCEHVWKSEWKGQSMHCQMYCLCLLVVSVE